MTVEEMKRAIERLNPEKLRLVSDLIKLLMW